MTYLLNLERAIAQTEDVGPWPVHKDDYYFTGWVDAGLDLTYSLSLSEVAAKEHCEHWLRSPETILAEDQGYYDRIKAIQLIMEKYDEKI